MKKHLLLLLLMLSCIVLEAQTYSIIKEKNIFWALRADNSVCYTPCDSFLMIFSHRYSISGDELNLVSYHTEGFDSQHYDFAIEQLKVIDGNFTVLNRITLTNSVQQEIGLKFIVPTSRGYWATFETAEKTGIYNIEEILSWSKN